MMRLHAVAALLGCALLATGALAEDAAPADTKTPEETAPAPSPAQAEEAAPAPAVGIQIAVTEDKEADEGPLKLPPGFRAKKRGKYTVYCRKDVAMGSRFPSEKCYDEQGLRDYIVDQRENQKQVDQMRRICGSMEACGGGG